ncbi:MAG: histidine kinase [Bacteroidetes bacterium]|nr:histidine kinase [Bacteroidota bacterium]
MSTIRSIFESETTGVRIQDFQKLMRYKVRDILLVASLYDYYLFEEDGRLYELIRQEFQALNLSHPPEITHVTSGAEAIQLLISGEHFDLVITTLHMEDMHVVQFAEQARAAGVSIPIVLLAYDSRERKELMERYNTAVFERIFVWHGDYRLIVAIIKYIEDKMNVENDVATVGVQCIILVEDSVSFYSSYLPLLYTEIFIQSRRLIAEGVNLTHKFLRMRARPKILLCSTYEEAWAYFEKYEEYILGVISDIDFIREGKKNPNAGVDFAHAVKSRKDDIPVLLQSSNESAREIAKRIGVHFLHKRSPTLLHDLSAFVKQHFGFGDFVFRMPDGTEVGRASNLQELEEYLKKVPDACIQYHAERNHFSNWLKARTEFWLAHKLRPRKVSDFPSIDALRYDLIDAIKRYKEERQRGIMTEFSKATFDPTVSFARIGTGSIGGKARGLGFLNTLINTYNLQRKFDGVEITVPSAVVIATDVFERFLNENNLTNIFVEQLPDEVIIQKFLDAPYFPPDVEHKLRDFLELMRVPLAVRSSSLLEDSQYQPFAGVYHTYMIPNNHPDSNVRLKELIESIKLVYASTYFQRAREYMKATPYHLEEERMAVIVQRMVGMQHEERFYPEFAGVAKSYNFYPLPPQKPNDGIVQVAVGLGYTVVEGRNSVRFCPKYPRHLVQFATTRSAIQNSQQEFLALDVTASFSYEHYETPDVLLKHYDVSVAERDGVLSNVVSTFVPEEDAIYDGCSREGRRLVTFAPMLKQHLFPLPEIATTILEIGSWGMGTQVELEFAVSKHPRNKDLYEFALLQIRPLVLSPESESIHIEVPNESALFCRSHQVLGNGVYRDVYDLIVVNPRTFERSKTKMTAAEVSYLNKKLHTMKRPYILVGFGRWGSLDPWLGIPVTWDQIAGVSVIVECGFADIDVTPSQGSHFFQNITSFRVGYFTINGQTGEGFVDWKWLETQQSSEELQYVTHYHFEKPLVVKINSQESIGVILKPEKG